MLLKSFHRGRKTLILCKEKETGSFLPNQSLQLGEYAATSALSLGFI
jgi:hypothetical protein